MAASAGTIILRDIKSNRTYSVDMYIPDAVATLLTFNPSGLAGTSSPSDYRIPADSVIVDITTSTAPTAVGGTLKVNSGVVNGGVFRWADRLNTLSKRADLVIPVQAGSFISVLQH